MHLGDGVTHGMDGRCHWQPVMARPECSTSSVLCLVCSTLQYETFKKCRNIRYKVDCFVPVQRSV